MIPLMKIYCGLLALGLSLSGVALGDASPQGCLSSDGRAKGCGGAVVSMPEPNAIPELVLCVAGLGFVALRQRKSLHRRGTASAS